jgi:hypothetical protein
LLDLWKRGIHSKFALTADQGKKLDLQFHPRVLLAFVGPSTHCLRDTIGIRLEPTRQSNLNMWRRVFPLADSLEGGECPLDFVLEEPGLNPVRRSHCIQKAQEASALHKRLSRGPANVEEAFDVAPAPAFRTGEAGALKNQGSARDHLTGPAMEKPHVSDRFRIPGLLARLPKTKQGIRVDSPGQCQLSGGISVHGE